MCVDLAKSCVNKLRVVSTFTKKMLHCLDKPRQLTDGISSNMGFECIVLCPDGYFKNLEGCFSGYGVSEGYISTMSAKKVRIF